MVNALEITCKEGSIWWVSQKGTTYSLVAHGQADYIALLSAYTDYNNQNTDPSPYHFKNPIHILYLIHSLYSILSLVATSILSSIASLAAALAGEVIHMFKLIKR